VSHPAADVIDLRVAAEELNEHTVGDADHALQLRLDLTGVRVATAGGLGKLLHLHKTLRARGGSLTVYNVPENVYEVFRLTRMTKVLDVRPKKAA
jgi:anti-anti-sigma factor